jgi:hypothetical protein
VPDRVVQIRRVRHGARRPAARPPRPSGRRTPRCSATASACGTSGSAMAGTSTRSTACQTWIGNLNSPARRAREPVPDSATTCIS